MTDPLQAGDVVALPDLVGQFEEPDEHRWHHLGMRDPMALHQCQESLGTEAGHHDDRTSGLQRRQRVSQGRTVIHR